MDNGRQHRPIVRRLGLVSALALTLAAGAAMAPAGVAVFAPTDAHAQAIRPNGGPASFSPVVKAVAPAVVHIEVTARTSTSSSPDRQNMPPGMREFFERFFGDRMPFGQGQPGPQRPRNGLGSGFFIDAEGHIVTNNHVIDGAEKIVVTMKDGAKLDAELIGADSRTDLALLKVKRTKPFPYVAWGDSDRSEVGDWVVAVGNPFGLDHTVTTGIISARGRSIGAGPYDDFLQIDAPINKGNSGGPAFNLNGEVVGVNTAIFSPTGGSVGIGFAIPASLAKGVIEQLKSGGVVRRGWLGVSIQTVSEDIAAGVGMAKPEGAIVSSIAKDGPASESDLRVGDVIVEVNGERIEEMPELPRVIAAIPPDETARIVVWRDGKERAVRVTLGALPAEDQLASRARPEAPSKGALGLTLAPLDNAARRNLGISNKDGGVLISEIDADSPLREKGVEPGSVLMSVAGQKVSDPSEAAEAIDEAREDGREAILLLIRTQNGDRFVAAELG